MTFRIEKKWRWIVAAGAVFVPGIVSGALGLPFTFKSGDPIRAADVNANFAALQSRLDALSTTSSATAPVGSVTIAGLATAVPIYQFSMSVDVPVAAGGAGQATGRPALSDITIVRDMGGTSPALDLQVSNQKLAATADLTLGNLSVHLTNVAISQLALSGTGAHPRETVGLSYQTIEWVWQSTPDDKKTLDYDRVKATGGTAAAGTFKLGYYAAGVAPDPAFGAISSFSHAITVPAVSAGGGAGGAKPQHSAFVVRKPVSTQTLDELGIALSGRTGSAVDLRVYDATGTVSNEIKLSSVSVQTLTLSIDQSGLSDSASFNYTQIQWLAGATQTAWDVNKNVAN